MKSVDMKREMFIYLKYAIGWCTPLYDYGYYPITKSAYVVVFASDNSNFNPVLKKLQNGQKF